MLQHLLGEFHLASTVSLVIATELLFFQERKQPGMALLSMPDLGRE
jgi:hypothetical protein